ncbi:portal protein [Bacillus phage vB_BanS_Nate]|uniref:Portal protein n=1 Tax=Bacillus phage vB_BanS_Nate TaxID=2894788 RepID=A0AAE8YUL9_9CAUD|nr:portal protein [Bacillus phage vB_BanS_Nate]UGO51083.1 portal protein [Bacillus phage vB_BanS_Nate]
MSEQTQENAERISRMNFDKMAFQRLIVNDLKKTREGRKFLKKYKQSEVREIVENFKDPKNQKQLVDISNILFAKSPQYQRLLWYLSKMALFSHVITPIRDISKSNRTKVYKQYTEIGELVKLMELRHEMSKVLATAFKEDVFYGYIHRDKKSFYIQEIKGDICQITSVEDGVYNFSIDMRYFESDEERLLLFGKEVQAKYLDWKLKKGNNSKVDSYVELSAENTICIKINENMLEVFPPFAGSFDAIFDIEGFKQLRKNKEELGNYMILTQQLPMRPDSEDNNDFAIDEETMRFFHEMASNTVPDNVGIITSPMKIEPVKFDRDRADSDGVAKAERDLWSGLGVSQLLFGTDKSTSQGLLMSIKTDEEIVFGVLTQIQRWINRYLKNEFKDLMFNINLLHVTDYNRQEMFKMYMEAGQYGVPVKSHVCAVVGLDPIETMNMAFLENDILKMHEKFVPFMSSHTMGGEAMAEQQNGRPKKDAKEVSDETARAKDKPSAE